MNFKKFLTSITKSLIVLFVATLIFSGITLNLPDLMKGVFEDVFAYASPEAQKQVTNKLLETCSSLEQGQELLTINQICTNRSLLESMKENCQNYRELKRKNIKIENEEKVRETCSQIESGEFKRACEELEKKSILPDFSKLKDLCKNYNEGKINDREFFLNVVSGAIPSEQVQMPKIAFLEKYSNAVNYLNSNKIIYFAILSILFVFLYLLIMDIKLFILNLARISFSIGILIMLPYFAILAYDKFIGIDTTPLLGSMFSVGNILNLKAILSVILLLFLRTYNNLIIILGIIFLAIGIAGKVYGAVLKRKERKTKKEKRD